MPSWSCFRTLSEAAVTSPTCDQPSDVHLVQVLVFFIKEIFV